MKRILTLLATSFLLLSAKAQCPDIFTGFDDSIAGAHVYFTDQSSTSNGWLIEDRHWDFGDGTTDSVVLNPMHTYRDPGSYTVYLRINGKLPQDSATSLTCEETTYRVVNITTTGLMGVTYRDELIIYPNPSNGYIQVKNTDGRVLLVSIYNMNGQLLAQTDQADSYIELPDNTNQASYFVRVTTEKGDVVRRILVQK
jgi:hypothetical protein